MVTPAFASEPPAARLTITTSRFGEAEQIVVPACALYTFPETLPGLPDSRRYALIGDESSAPLFWLQSLEEGPVCLPMVEVQGLQVEGYAEQVSEALGAEPAAARVFVVTRFDPEHEGFIVNLLAPIVLDLDAGTGRQIILEGQSFPLRRAVRWDAEARVFIAPC
ncbi:MAG: flagellar assembly protein FliW [Chloroflexota bacterium]